MSDERIQVSRRDVLRGAGVAAVLGGVPVVGARSAAAQQAADGLARHGPQPLAIEFTLNGETTRVKVEPRTTLLDALRDRLGKTGSKRVCDRGACGACTVHVDGRTVNACMMLAIDAAGAEVRTIEGLSADGELHPVQTAFVAHDAQQCGFCTPGMVMSCVALVEGTKNPSDEQIRHAVSGNLCRCGTYPHVFSACREASK